MAEIHIRAAEPDDAEALNALYLQPLAFSNTLQLPWRSVEFRRQRYATTDSYTHRLVALIEERIVGDLGLHVEEGPRRRGIGGFGMAVHDEFHGQGVGSALMAAMLDLADNWLNLHRVELTVYTDNAPAIHLYEKFGFVIEGTARKYAFRGGRHIDAHYMARVR